MRCVSNISDSSNERNRKMFFSSFSTCTRTCSATSTLLLQKPLSLLPRSQTFESKLKGNGTWPSAVIQTIPKAELKVYSRMANSQTSNKFKQHQTTSIDNILAIGCNRLTRYGLIDKVLVPESDKGAKLDKARVRPRPLKCNVSHASNASNAFASAFITEPPRITSGNSRSLEWPGRLGYVTCFFDVIYLLHLTAVEQSSLEFQRI